MNEPCKNKEEIGCQFCLVEGDCDEELLPTSAEVLTEARENVRQHQELTRKLMLECADLERRVEFLTRENNRLTGLLKARKGDQ